MKKGICTAYVRRQTLQYLCIGPVSLAAGIALAALTRVFSGTLWEVIANFGKNFVYIAVILFLVLGGGCLLFSGVRGLFWTQAADICQFIRSELPAGQKSLPGQEMLALVDRDLASALEYANGTVLIGREWLFVRNAWGKPVIRLEHIQGIFHHQTPKGAVVLKFADPRGAGPVARELTADEAGRIEAYLQRKVVHQ